MMETGLSFSHISGFTLLGTAIIAGFYVGHLARRVNLPSLIGYMIFGVILGPSILNILDVPMLEGLSFLTEMALGFVAVNIGLELSISSLKRLGTGIVSIILAESFMAFLVVFSAIYLLTRNLPLSIILGAIAPASAPAGTVAVIQECRAKGSMTKALYAVVGFDDGLAIIIFGLAFAVAKNFMIGEASDTTEVLSALLRPMMLTGLSVLLGGIIGLLFFRMVLRLQIPAEILIIAFGAVFLATGLSIRWHLSLILTNMVVGFVLANRHHAALVPRVEASLAEIMPLMFILFFCLAGAHLKISALPALGSLGCVYILGRSAGKIGGAGLGALFGRVEKKIKKYLGFGILSQAGVAIGLSLIVKQEFTRLAIQHNLPQAEKIGVTVITTITATSIFFELIGPILTRFALKRAGEIPSEDGWSGISVPKDEKR
ncbi:MAG: cation:proton antiporter [Thermodesulfobacteriota bacterium]|nr:cation:proton antiporter [Thermodesulfobacteriota bacterium]